MPANNDMEILMQQKMAEFQLEPSPADWQAIYEKLHPKKDRRFVWWWLPLVAGLLFGGYWIINHNDISSSNKTTTTELPSAKTPAGSTKSSDRSTGNTQQSDAVSFTSETPISAKQIADLPTTSKNQFVPIKESNNKAVSKSNTDLAPSTKTKGSSSNPEHSGQQSIVTTNKEKPVEQNSPIGLISPEEKSMPLEHDKITDNKNEIVTVPIAISDSDEIKQYATDKKPIPVIHVESTKDTVSSPTQAIVNTQKKQSIPNLSTHNNKGWFLGVYAALGSNHPTEPMSMTKSADLSSAPGTNNSITYEGTGSEGLHYALGISVERRLKNTSFTFGLGIQHNTWSSASSTYRDSIWGSNLYSRTLIANNTTRYSHTAVEIPLIANFRIAGKKASSLWLNAGFNNAITLTMNKKTDVISVQSNTSYSGDNSPVSNAHIYQPQFRLGLTYENSQKQYHWQLNPFLQYGLNSMVKSGIPDINMLHLGLQARYYFKRLR